MKEKIFFFFLIVALLAFPSCGGITPITGERATIPLSKANQKAVFEENEGLQIIWEDARDARDFYRGGVQQKAKAESQFQQKAYSEAMKSYQASNEFFTKILQFISEDSAEYTLYEGTDILFFPNLLMADNYTRMGIIGRETGRQAAALSNWRKAQDFVNRSLLSERTEWGLSLQQEILSLSGPKKN